MQRRSISAMSYLPHWIASHNRRTRVHLSSLVAPEWDRTTQGRPGIELPHRQTYFGNRRDADPSNEGPL